MSCYRHLTIEEREKLYALLEKGEKKIAIAKILGRSPSTVSRELMRNGGEEYLPSRAQSAYAEHRKRSVRKPVLSNPELHSAVHFFLGYMFWSPEQIANRLKFEGTTTVSTSTIYRALENGQLQDTLRYYLRFKYKKIGKAKKPCRKCFSKSIEEREKAANDRSEIGHWEGDTVVSHISKAVIATLVDRKSRFLVASKVSCKEAPEVRKVVVRILKNTGKRVKSITFDQGTEFSEGAEMENDLHTSVYFAHPHSPWERPTNENTNGLLRQFIPKRSDFANVSDEDILHFVALLNFRPRKCLNWSTPYEVFSNNLLHFT